MRFFSNFLVAVVSPPLPAPNKGARARPGPAVCDRPLRRDVGGGPRDQGARAFAGDGQEADQGARGQAYSQLHQVRRRVVSYIRINTVLGVFLETARTSVWRVLWRNVCCQECVDYLQGGQACPIFGEGGLLLFLAETYVNLVGCEQAAAAAAGGGGGGPVSWLSFSPDLVVAIRSHSAHDDGNQRCVFFARSGVHHSKP